MKDNTMNSLLKTSLSASLLALSASLPALAADINQGDPTATNYVAPEKANWSGLWVGAVGGYSFFNSETSYDKTKFELNDSEEWVPSDYVRRNESATINGLGAEGLFGEIQLGYDHQVSNQFVIGVFGGLNVSDAEFSASASDGGEQVFSVTSDYEWGGILGARLGLIKSPDTMFYLAGGWAYAQLGDTTGHIFDEAFTIDGPELNGWFGEVGMETRVYNNVYLTVSGRYTDYGSETLWSDVTPGHRSGTEYRESVEIDTDALTAMVGLKVKLNGGLGF